MFTILISVIIILAVLLVLVILAQDSKGGVGAAFGGSASQIMGVTKTGNILEKATWVLSIAILVLSLSSAAFYSTESGSDFRSPNVENARKQVVSPSFGEGEGLLPSNIEGQDGETPIETPEEDGSED
ncbi:preprotein translocase subunit SecG [Mongoliibacter ruber]|uniref:Protein-export membrane protein SecG n=1 Tax=Mongoliibacter ruber TaxID=1750599 RepID=A0A2T0WK18_9BACT|nr:preprotein translocase subunit SecG [Mongoliibacter ruber]PRY87015.1 preprotein translocase subunit SecG [Mongoliibacter ruber]